MGHDDGNTSSLNDIVSDILTTKIFSLRWYTKPFYWDEVYFNFGAGSSGEALSRENTYRRIFLLVNRAFDIVFSLVLLIAFAWLFAIVSVVIKLYDKGPVFYMHSRVGMHGKNIMIPKFRTMKVNADRLESMLTPEQLEQYRKEYKINNDPRITGIGDFLRKTSMDELPQLWSVLKGDLCFIGPRPIIRSELESNYTAKQQQDFCSVKPGLTGYWQAYARNKASYQSGERQRMEMYYVRHMSIGLNTRIFFKTIVTVLMKVGAQ